MTDLTPKMGADTFLMTSEETALKLRKTTRWLFDQTERPGGTGTLKCVRFENSVMYRPSDVNAWLDERQANPLPPKVGKPIVKRPKRGGKRTASTSK